MAPSVIRSFVLFAILIVVSLGIVAGISYVLDQKNQQQVSDY
jgi:hypothetical protein